MTNIYFQDKQKDLEQIKIELQKAKLDVEPEYSFEFMGWKFNRTRRRWDVEATSKFGFTKEQGMILHNTPFPIEYFDEPMNTEKQQQDLVDSIKHELAKENEFYKPSSYFHSVWFQPSSGRFLFADQYTRYEIVEPLIENKTLTFKGIENHQGEQMLRYVLS